MNIKDKTILIVDDSELYRTALSTMLEDLGVGNILIAKDGLEGVRMARYYKPDLVLLDLEMPNIDGYEACQKIRLFTNKVSMPIIIITGQETEELLNKLFEMGANDCLEKPFDMAEIGNRIVFYLEYCETLQKLNALGQDIQNDLNIAKSVQNNTILSADKAHERLQKTGLDFYSFYQLSDGLGGDLWTVHTLKNGDPVFLLCDVSGHGINAAINSSFIVSTIKSTFELYKHLDTDMFKPDQFLDRLNFILSAHIQTGTFCAGACLVYSQDEHTIAYAGCALPDFRLLDLKTGSSDLISVKGMPMGIYPDDLDPTSGKINLDRDKLLLCMTDGLTESMTEEQQDNIKEYTAELPGEIMLHETLENICKIKGKKSSENCMNAIIDNFKAQNYSLNADDVTIIAMQRI